MRDRLKPKSFLDDARRDWQFQAFAWLLRHTGGYAKFLETTLVLPTEEHFPDRGLKGHAAVAALFRRVRDHAGMADWPCTVEPASETPRIATDDSGRIPVFTYAREGLEPISLVASFARDFARYLVLTVDEPPPGGEDMREPALEVAAVFLGFGVFLANAVISAQPQALNEGELVHSLALYCLLQRTPPEAADEHLNPHLRKYLRLAVCDLARHEARFQSLRGVAAVDPAECTLPVSAG
jgi:hypothetical protein